MGSAARDQRYMGAPIGVVEIHLQLEIATPRPPPPLAPPVNACSDQSLFYFSRPTYIFSYINKKY